jgi:hypothetical protein
MMEDLQQSNMINKNHKYVFEGGLILRGNGLLFPLDKYISEIQVNGGEGELFEKHQSLTSQESGYNLDVYFIKNNIKIERTRANLSRYITSLLILMFLGYILNSHIKTLNNFQLNDRKIELIFGGILATLAVAISIGFDNLNFIISAGILPFVIFVLFLGYKYYKIRDEHSKPLPMMKNENFEISTKKSESSDRK